MLYDLALIASLASSAITAPQAPFIHYQAEGLMGLSLSVMRGDVYKDINSELGKYGFGGVKTFQTQSSFGYSYQGEPTDSVNVKPVTYTVTSYKVTLEESPWVKSQNASITATVQQESDGDVFFSVIVNAFNQSAQSTIQFQDNTQGHGLFNDQTTVTDWTDWNAGVSYNAMASSHYVAGDLVSQNGSMMVDTIGVVGVAVSDTNMTPSIVPFV